MLKSATAAHATDWSSDGRFLIADTQNAATGSDLFEIALTGDHKPVALLQGSFNERGGTLSPDGRWIAYQSDESKSWQVYVQAMPPSGERWQISNAGGGFPRWRGDGKELFYVTPDLKLMSVDITTRNGAFDASAPKLLFQTTMAIPNAGLNGDRQYDVTSDGSQFVIVTRTDQGDAPPVHLVMNWPALVKK